MSTLQHNILCSQLPKCPFGINCKFAHSKEEQMWNLFQRTSFCPDKECPDKKNCPYSHDSEEIKSKSNEKIKLCNKGKKCDKSYCTFAHTESEVVPKYNFCFYGDRCTYKDCERIHPKEPEPRVEEVKVEESKKVETKVSEPKKVEESKKVEVKVAEPKKSIVEIVDEEIVLGFGKIVHPEVKEEPVKEIPSSFGLEHKFKNFSFDFNIEPIKYTSCGVINTALCISLQNIDGIWCFPSIKRSDNESDLITASRSFGNAVPFGSKEIVCSNTLYFMTNMDVVNPTPTRWFSYTELMNIPLHPHVHEYLKTLHKN